MEKIGKVYSEYQDGNLEAWYYTHVVDPNDLESRQIILSDGDEFCVGRSDDDDTWGFNIDFPGGILWREMCPLPDTRNDAERDRDKLRVERDELRVIIGKIANEVGNPDSDARIRGILLTSMDLLGNAKIY